MTTKSTKKVSATIIAQNDAFAKLSKAEQRVAIAKDVIKWLAKGKLTATGGSYLDAQLLAEEAYVNPKGSFQTLLPKIPTCDVCAKGALFVCTVARRNKITNEKAQYQEFAGSSLTRALGGIFSADQLDMIEAEFEGVTIYGRHVPVMALSWDNEDRMVAIMKNIIKNKGTFIPVAP